MVIYLATYPTLSAHVTHAFAPGRVNLIGEHTDYNEGLALPFAITAGVTVTATRLAGDSVEALALDLDETDAFPLRGPHATHGWRAFVRGAVAELERLGYSLPGARIEITGDLPRGAGLSSSAALELSLCLALIELSGAQPPERVELARLGQRIEHDWVGAQTGLLDQLASLSGAADHAVLIDFRTLEITPMPLALGEHALVTLSSGQPHANAASGYNRRREECVEAAHRMGVESLRDALIQDLHMLPDVLARRARHVISENGRVLGAVAALRRSDFEHLGRLLDLSHTSLRDDFEISTPAVEHAVRELKDAGALGARLLGGGFGGNVLGLMPPGTVAPAGATVVSPGRGAHLLA
ncbi:MAG TPA: galactokinase [Solirubrobacteraceae bacterium]|nr:galactokinase [Solirubrobacteraceae bacterium]